MYIFVYLSDNSGLWSDYLFTSVQNQTKAWLPLNPISEKIYYTADVDGTPINQRVVVSAPNDHPIVWKVSKEEDAASFGIAHITLAQDLWDPNRDYIDKDDVDDIFAMYANYFVDGVTPIDDETNDYKCVITSSVPTIKIKGGYRKFTCSVFNVNGEEMSNIAADKLTWAYTIDGEDATELLSVISDGVTRKIKFLGDRSYINKILHISCSYQWGKRTIEGSTDVSIGVI